jgi:hypothetical protein
MSKTSVLDLFGIDWVCNELMDLRMLTEIAGEADVALSTLSQWIASDADRSARVREARRLAADAWVEKAEQVVTEAKNGFELQRARELAHHYRWKASKISPAYNDKVVQEHTGPGGGPVSVTKIELVAGEPE